MKISAFDLGTKLGWAADTSGRLEWGEQDFSLKRGESPGMRFHAFNQWLFDIAGGREMSLWSTFTGEFQLHHTEPFQTAPELIVYELPHLRGGAATDVLVGFATRIHEFCAVWSKCRPMEYAAVHSATLKKFALGKGRGEKKEMVQAAYARLPMTGAANLTDNMADALWLYWYAKDKLIGAGESIQREVGP